ncbi:helix-turn-helix domain-containing protein [Enterococcus faecalis]|nr:helix-turn-helix domain-containing protein [Enterococcus faecalis]
MFPSYLTNELEILFYIVKRAHTSLNEISSNLKISKRTVKENLIKINQEFEDTYQIQHFIVSNNNGIVCVNPAYRKSAVEYAYTLKLNLLKNNVQFNYCVQLVTHSSIDKNELIKVLYISEHYLVKITKQLNNFFKIFDIVIVSIKGIYQLTGNELSIRVFSFIFLQDSFQELAWPFSKISLEEIKKKST